MVKRSHQLLTQKHCRRGQTSLTWNQHGPAGPPGPTGAQGATGAAGAPGAAGQNAVSLWIQSDPNGNAVGGQGLKVFQQGTGEYVISPTSEPPAPPSTCAVTVTPFSSSVLPPATPITASVAFAGTGYNIFLSNSMTGAAVNDGFAAAIQC